ncbi:hypothetical protein H6F93_10975 [Leptolyngbya sp. FACHB-671]|uniref:AfsR/SARP family transcriptional regulator n=1 Tax=Leptolyngbya sp. FACHB-671 TaxID=2692812 RepID=UPI001687FCDE|nr:BTAD domain-containing putative transcriptional regulator [Leptolyngbya sp. FACHB-671]MBD2068040.1 hypothetical protein [Leptolyngbya sp. FACHB-671]
MSHLSFALLGPMQVTLNGQPIVAFPYEKVRALLAYLAIESQYPHHRDALAALLWSERSQSDARSNLRKALSVLRRLLDDITHQPPVLLATRHTIQINPLANYTLDVERFKELLDHDHHHEQVANDGSLETIACLERAVALYRGPFLDRLHLPHSEAFETWMFHQRQRLHDQVIDAHTKLMKHHELHGHYEKAQQYAQQQLQLEPWNESAYCCLMRVLAQNGRRTAALQQFERCCHSLRQELATEPDATTVELWQAIRAGSSSKLLLSSIEKLK